MAGYVSKFATGATIEAILDKANNSQSVSAAEKTAWNGKQNALTTAQLSAVNSGVTADMLTTLANNGAKNFLKPIIESATVNGVTMTLQTDGTYALSGTSSAAGSKTRMFDMSALSSLSGQTVKLTGGYSNSIRLNVYSSTSASTPSYIDTGSGVEFTLTPELIESGDIRIAFLADADCTNVVISPMLRPASITDDTYIPYGMTNEKITKELDRRNPDTMGIAIVDPDPNNGVYADLFTLSVGKYNRQVNANLVQNIPADLGNTAFYCEVVNTISNLRRQIRLYPCTVSTSNCFYLCLETASGFGAWHKFVDETVLTSTIPQLMALNDDVNNYRISESISNHSGIKRWVCPSSTVRNSLTNLPADFPSYPDFEIEFRQFKSNGVGMQTITGGSASSMYIAKRFFKNDTFSPWYKVVTEEVT